MSGKRKSVLQTRSVEDDSLIEEDENGKLVTVVGATYDNVSSPDSTSSGPTYAPRRPGFQHHAHNETIKNLKAIKYPILNKKTLDTSPTLKKYQKREPLPMKLRALPQSFWQQPNEPTSISPAYPVLPPLSSSSNTTREDTLEETGHEQLLLSAANTELLFSLFRTVEEQQNDELSVPPVVRRGRPKRAPSHSMIRVLNDDDPCLAASAGFPLLIPIQNTLCQPRNQQLQQNSTIQEESINLPSLSGFDSSYSQILSELVFRL